MKRMLAGVLALAATTIMVPLTLIPDAYAYAPEPPADVATARTVAPDDPMIREHPNMVRTLKSWIVQDGQNLSVIAGARYGDQNVWPLVYWANHKHIRWADKIQVGQVLVLPVWTGYLPKAPRFTSPPPPPPRVVAHRAHNGGGSVAYSSGTHRTYHRIAVSSSPSYQGHYSYAGLMSLWIAAGGPSWAASHAASIAECESGGNVHAYNPSGATGLWQILGSVVGGNLYNPYTNAANAVAKFRASGDTFAQWVCQ